MKRLTSGTCWVVESCDRNRLTLYDPALSHMRNSPNSIQKALTPR
jgi:hypothetical protein